MTDMMSEAFGRELVTRQTFTKEGVWLPLLAVHHMNAGDPVIRDKTFTDCVIEGPALVLAMGSTSFDSCNMGVAADPRSLLYKAQGPMLVGAIGLENCHFVRCRMVQIGYAGTDTFLDEMANQLIAAQGIQA
ncbi:hypothetical protein [Brevundimonas nasdae]|uniref:Uncharacterized protein n=1 Tax=Brevundimonas nasdae TaxID=172043 RepID=A0ABX8TGE5_9CAUL|nr:hypothetical protein [Brevundimonas nasdae]QYC10298.1 hypothetical protein KWG56_17420 [Brevundimonas nasdae]QYC13086.1 hypothetical protein KWG63_12740 [Brevundimonas nasdae]